jgi:hypothetical protein
MTGFVFAALALWIVGALALLAIDNMWAAGSIWLVCKLAGIVFLLLPLPRWLRRRNQPV